MADNSILCVCNFMHIDHVRETKRQIWDGVSSIVDEDYMSPQVETDALHVYDTVFPVCMKKQHPSPVENLPAIKDASISDDNEVSG